jgi:hypothetical protein
MVGSVYKCYPLYRQSKKFFMKRNTVLSLSSVFLCAVLFIVLSLINPWRDSPPPPSTPIPDQSPRTVAESLNSRNLGVKNVFLPSMRMGLISRSSLFYDRRGDLIFTTWLAGSKEGEVGCSGDDYWFWVKSFDKDSIYWCRRDRLEHTPLRPLMMPEVIRAIAWVTDVDASLAEESGDIFVSESKDGPFRTVVEFDHEKILSQSIFHRDTKIVTMEGHDYSNLSGIKLPKRVRAIWHEEGMTDDFYIKAHIVNGEDQEISPPEGMKRINLESLGSSSS